MKTPNNFAHSDESKLRACEQIFALCSASGHYERRRVLEDYWSMFVPFAPKAMMDEDEVGYVEAQFELLYFHARFWHIEYQFSNLDSLEESEKSVDVAFSKHETFCRKNIGNLVRIEWEDEADWHYFSIVKVSKGKIKLKGEYERELRAEHNGPPFWISLSEIKDIKLVK